MVSPLTFLAGLVAVIYLPGRSLLRLSGFRGDRLESLVLSCALGAGAAALVIKGATAFGRPRLVFVWAAAALIHAAAGLRRGSRRPAPPGPRPARAGVALAAMAAILLVVLGVDNFRNGLVQPDGSRVVNMRFYDGFIRTSMIREVSHSVPPQLPFAAGTPLNYHYGLDLIAGFFHAQLGLDVLDLYHRYLPAFFFGLLLLGTFLFIRQLFSEESALWGTFLVLFGSGGLYFAASLLLGAPQGGNIFYSFYFFDFLALNTLLHSLAILFPGFFCLGRYLAGGRRPDLILAAALLALTSEFKVFFIWPVLAALLCAGAAAWLKFRDRSLLKAFSLTAALFLPLLLFTLLRGGGISYNFGLGFVDWVGRALANLKLAGLESAWSGVVTGSAFSASNLLKALLGLAVFLLGSWGLSVAAVPGLVRRVFSFGRDEVGKLFLAWLCGVSIVYFVFFNIRLVKLPRNIVNIYVYYLGVILLIIFWADMLARHFARTKTLQKTAAFLLVSALCVPNGARFLADKVRVPNPRTFSASFLETADWLNSHSEPEDVVLHPIEMTYLCYFADRRVVLDASIHSYLDFHLPQREIRRRKTDVARFFNDPAGSGEVLAAYGVRLIWVPSGTVLPASSRAAPARTGGEEGNEAAGFRLEKVFENGDFALWRVR